MKLLSKSWLLGVWDDLKGSFWFLPTLMALAASAFSQLSLEIDANIDPSKYVYASFLYTGSAEGARSVLSIIASSMIGVAGVVFSITIVVLTLASQKYGPRAFRSFTQDRSNHIVLGSFLSTFLYCLIVLRQVHGQADSSDKFIPQVSILCAGLAAVACLGLLIYFIHHVTVSIQSPIVITQLGRELSQAVPETFRHRGNSRESCLAATPRALFLASKTGYIRRIDLEGMLEVASSEALVFKTLRMPGDFVHGGEPLLEVSGLNGPADDIFERLELLYSLGEQRTQEQDIRFVVEQLVGVALMALSPSTNDPFSAIQVVESLGAGLGAVAELGATSNHIADAEGKLLVIFKRPDFQELMKLAFSEIRHCSKNQMSVMESLIRTFSQIARHAQTEEQHACIRLHEAAVAKILHAKFDDPADSVERVYQRK